MALGVSSSGFRVPGSELRSLIAVLVLNGRDAYSALNVLVHSPWVENIEVKLSSQISGFAPESFRIEVVSRTTRQSKNPERRTRNAERGTRNPVPGTRYSECETGAPCSRKFINL